MPDYEYRFQQSLSRAQAHYDNQTPEMWKDGECHNCGAMVDELDLDEDGWCGDCAEDAEREEEE